MSEKHIRVEALQNAIMKMNLVFSTRDVADDDAFRVAHKDHVADPRYNVNVGKALSKHRVALGIREIEKKTDRGSVWEKQVV